MYEILNYVLVLSSSIYAIKNLANIVAQRPTVQQQGPNRLYDNANIDLVPNPA